EQNWEIRTPRLLLRAAISRDVDDLHEIFRESETMRYWSTKPHPDREMTEGWVQRMIDSSYNGVLDFVIVEIVAKRTANSPGKVLGKVGSWDGIEVGFIMNRDWWGRGLAYEALTTVLDHIRALLDRAHKIDINQLKADVDPRNARSLKLLTKLGFKEVGRAEKTFETEEGWADSTYLEL
ncbi:acetyltransferase, partial [Pluteus cervinus]